MHAIDDLKQWIGRTETLSDQVTPAPLRGLIATLDGPQAKPRPGDSIPPCGHWLYCLPADRQSEIGADGHARRGGFLPPVPLFRRMWAGSRLEFLRPLEVGQAITRTSRILDVSTKEGRTGSLVFVRVRHEIVAAAGPAVIEEQDIVYRDMPKLGDPIAPPEPAPRAHEWAREVAADAVLLFRYSALSFNSHRIHYDRRYATEVERYPGLVVHGPLIATLLLDLLRRHMPDARVLRFSFRAVKPVFDVAPFGLRGARAEDGETVRLWAQDTDDCLCMDATAVMECNPDRISRGPGDVR